MHLFRHNNNFLPVLGLSLLVAVVFWNAIPHEFVWDDHIFATYKDAYKNFDMATILFSLANGLEYQPVRDITYALDFAMWGNNPAGFHFSNVYYYWLTIIVVYGFSAKLAELLLVGNPDRNHARAKITGFLIAALFAVHPLHCEVVNFITCRNALISGIFFFLSCHAFLLYLTGTENKSAKYYGLSLFCFILALLAKTTVIILPLIMFLFTGFFSNSSWKRKCIALSPFVLLSGAAFTLFREIALKTHIMQSEATDVTTLHLLTSKVALSLQIPVFYLKKLAVPLDLSVVYDTKFTESMTDLRVIIPLFLIVVIATISWLLRRRFPPLLFFICWYLIALIPVLHIFPTNPIVADRYAYLPSFAFISLLVIIGVLIASRRQYTWMLGGSIVLIAALSVIAYRQNTVWQNPKTLWTHAVEVSPYATGPLVNLGRYYYLSEKNDVKALELFKKAQELNPNDCNLDIFQGVEFLRINDPHNAISALYRAFLKNGEHMETLVNLGKAYEATGNLNIARDYYRRAINSSEADPPGDMREQAKIYLKQIDDK